MSIDSEYDPNPISRFSIVHDNPKEVEMERLMKKYRILIAMKLRERFTKKKEKDSIFEANRRKTSMKLTKDSTTMGYSIFLIPELKDGLDVSSEQ